MEITAIKKGDRFVGRNSDGDEIIVEYGGLADWLDDYKPGDIGYTRLVNRNFAGANFVTGGTQSENEAKLINIINRNNMVKMED